ncbi:recombinase family protein [Leisingera aquaemixtae]|uniref:recombinase family protein n=1 Tax=Leisingera aquaemixtae TaxID=1396826 RepID=UPI001C97F1C9|nr:recombinase family protein [Leisingera aquaemixtae]MBY6069634.1 recombinase family protein [Leisingera aquaemixtae]
MSQPRLRAAIYARYSTDLQRDASVEDQIRDCTDYAKAQGLEVVATYSDRAISGASLMRSGMQALLRDARGGTFDVVVSEALDRLSRNQADIAHIYQEFCFSGLPIETVADGLISEIHIGLKGTMNALQLKDIAMKTHRGLKGRALAGKSAGGKAYGYDLKPQLTASGDLIRGEREINPEEAKIVRRIFQDYARGLSPKKIAEALNTEGVPAPSGRHWGASTIHGNRQRGSGILNNELYTGRQVWNRLRYVKDPQTGKRISRLNPESEWTITDVPQLRIVEQDLWDAVRARQGELKTAGTKVPVWDRRRPKTLFSGLMACGCCGGGFAKISKDSFGCSPARNKGAAVCSNKRTIKQADLEARVLDALANHLMDPDAVQIFCEEYTAERNRLKAAAAGNRKEKEQALARAKRDHQKLVDAIIAGIPADQVKDRMIELDTRRQQLERELEHTPAPDTVVFHPSMAEAYRERVSRLIQTLGPTEGMEEAKEALRALVERIVLTPAAEGAGLDLTLEGDLAGLLRLAAGAEGADTKKAPDGSSEAFDISEEIVLVAGAGFEPATFRL